ncbi:hypothetical protein [Natrinema versiforme]|uniref:Uncharacterized protein n=1 Tax=Natrinema versiforme TaxID=88724 RepID=A0A4P8WMT4_9EURY|nr:hypothetical protein [Natrinema versiforme]QCS44744.1 hypothetical protein FEJ81_20940 [Natrinema versiforme]
MSFIRRAAAAVKYSFTEPAYQQLKHAEQDLREDGVVSVLAAVNIGQWPIESKETIQSRIIDDLDELEEYRSELRQQMAA